MVKLELGELREVISAMDASWEAGETEISPYLDQPQETGLFGLSISEDERQQEFNQAFVQESEALVAAAPPPAAIDWRNHNRRNWVTPIKHQRTCGACIAFATCAVLESRTRLARNDADFAIDLSEADLFFCGRGGRIRRCRPPLDREEQLGQRMGRGRFYQHRLWRMRDRQSVRLL